ncbi:DEAD/DEAH box helicase [Thalassotalea fusca]
MSFNTLGLSTHILQAIEKQGYQTPSPIQEQAIPKILAGKDVMAAAQTGTGKTAGFTLPILDMLSKGQRAKANHIRALVLTPTRELAAQVGDSVATYGEYTPLSSLVVYGGVKINPQMMKLRSGVDILVATPGRLLDLYEKNSVKFSQVEILVLDEADRMLDMGFIRDLKKIIQLLPKQRQNLMFSATFSPDIKTLAKGLMHQPSEVSVTPENSTTKLIEQSLIPVDKKQKPRLLTYLIQENDWQQVLIFCRTKHGANRLTRTLEAAEISAMAIHGNKSQGARTKALAAFKAGEIRALVATDIAARGLDIDQLPQVVNFELPNVPEDYVHRIGRTGRAGTAGHAISLVCADEIKELQDIEYVIQQHIVRKQEPGFTPVNELPESRTIKPLKAKKPKKPKKPKTDSQAEGTQGASENQPTKSKQNSHSTKRSNKPHQRRDTKPKTKQGDEQPHKANKKKPPKKRWPSN